MSMNQPSSHLIRRRGFTLTELAIVLGVISVVIAGIFSIAEPNKDVARVQDALNRMTVITSNMGGLLQSGWGMGANPCKSYPPLPNGMCHIVPDLIILQVIPSWMVTAGNVNQSADNLWENGGLDVVWFPNSSPHKYRVSFYGVDSMQSCISLITQATNCTAGQPGCPVAVYTNYATINNIYTPANSFNTQTTKLTSAAVETLCAQNPYGQAPIPTAEFDFIN
jgi:prepilin-type N-terminal cleavage/methylation domain-containing protein